MFIFKKTILTVPRAFCIMFIAVLSIGLSAQELRIGTASLGGAFYPMGQSISNLVNKYAGNDIRMVPVVTGGSVQNPRLVDSGEVDIAITNSNLAVLALKGAGPYRSGVIDMRAVAALHPSVLHMVVLKGSDIKTLSDIKGRKIAVGPAGGGTLGLLDFVLPFHGLSLGDTTPNFLSYADGFSQLADGNVDAAFALSGFPAGAVMQAAAGHDLEFITFDAGKLEEALAANPAYTEVVIPADVYGTSEPARFLGINNMLVAPTSFDADVIERVVVSIFDHLDEFQAENANAKQIDPAMSKSMSIPLHDGAARYFNK